MSKFLTYDFDMLVEYVIYDNMNIPTLRSKSESIISVMISAAWLQ